MCRGTSVLIASETASLCVPELVQTECLAVEPLLLSLSFYGTFVYMAECCFCIKQGEMFTAKIGCNLVTMRRTTSTVQ